MTRSRSWLGAVAVAVFAVLMVGRSVFAEPPPAMEVRELPRVIDALKKAKGRRTDLAAVRFYAEVFGGTELRAPVGSSLETLGAWGDNEALTSAEGSLNGCPALEPEKQKIASALLKEYGNELPVLLRAYTIAGEGKKKDAADLFAQTLESISTGAKCPGEHPMYSYRRTGRMTLILACVKSLDPKRDVKKLEKMIEQANFCAQNNHAVG
ncbi:MAG: hypothetical protein QM817_26805 [Archangium sp.]